MFKPPLSFFIHTFGCSLNYAESDAVRNRLVQAGYEEVKSDDDADVVLVNTCGVKNTTVERISHLLRTLHQKHKKVVVFGCLTRDRARILKSCPDATIFEPQSLPNVLSLFSISSSDYPINEPTFPIYRLGIEDGCFGNCAFCFTKQARRSRMSLAPEEVIKRMKKAATVGVREIDLCGVDLGAYDWHGAKLHDLMLKMHDIDACFMVRVGMMNPKYACMFRHELARAFESRLFYRFIHLPVQTGSEKVCAEMGRVHTVQDFRIAARFFKSQGFRVATDIIVGYPTESEEDFQKTLDLIRDVRPDVVNISKFSPRPFTEAQKMKQLDTSVVKRRSLLLHNLVMDLGKEAHMKLEGQKIDVFVVKEATEANLFIARTKDYVNVFVHSKKEIGGRWVNVKVVHAGARSLRAVLSD